LSEQLEQQIHAVDVTQIRLTRQLRANSNSRPTGSDIRRRLELGFGRVSR
jgi:hypothetical protein